MNQNYYKDIIDVPSKIEIEAMTAVYNFMELTGNLEWGFVVGVNNQGEKKIFFNEEEDEESTLPNEQEAIDNGYTPIYDAHGHPPTYKELPNGNIQISSNEPSDKGDGTGDLPTRQRAESNNRRNVPDVVLGYDFGSFTMDTKGNLQPAKQERVVTFYNANYQYREDGNGNANPVYNPQDGYGTITFDVLKKIAKTPEKGKVDKIEKCSK